MAASIELLPNGRFEFGQIYGGVERSAKGRWKADGNTLTLDTDLAPAADFVEGERSSTLLGDYGTEADKPTLLVVRVSTPRLGLTWSNMEVVGEFSNGHTRSGVTGRSGMLGFLKFEERQWAGATIKRVSVAYPKADVKPVWFNLDPSIKGLEVHFEPGSLTPAAFQSAVLLVGKQSVVRTLVVRGGDLGPVGWRFVRQ